MTQVDSLIRAGKPQGLSQMPGTHHWIRVRSYTSRLSPATFEVRGYPSHGEVAEHVGRWNGGTQS